MVRELFPAPTPRLRCSRKASCQANIPYPAAFAWRRTCGGNIPSANHKINKTPERLIPTNDEPQAWFEHGPGLLPVRERGDMPSDPSTLPWPEALAIHLRPFVELCVMWITLPAQLVLAVLASPTFQPIRSTILITLLVGTNLWVSIKLWRSIRNTLSSPLGSLFKSSFSRYLRSSEFSFSEAPARHIPLTQV